MNVKRSITVVAALALTLTGLPAPAWAATPTHSADRLTVKERLNKRVALAAVDELLNKHDLSAVDRYYREPYIQHNPDIANGFAGVKAAITGLPNLHYDVFQTLADGDFVTVDARVTGLGDTTKIIMDVFRLDRGRIVEHWDIIQDEVPASETVSGNSMISTPPPAQHPRQDNERVVIKALDRLYGHRDLTAIDRYWRDPYVEHAPFAANGTAALRTAVRNLPAGFSYEPGLVMSEGDEVVVHARITGIAPTPVIAIQIFRLDRGKIVEHWQNIQKEVPADQSANGNPMTTPRITA
ncbi:nuclear transport factor 2 family protein [Amycolatopsis sp. NPDC004747]